MPTIKNFQRQVRRIEGFDVRVLHPDGRDVRDDMRIKVDYPYLRAAASNVSVAEWRKRRAETVLPGFEVVVLSAGGKVVHGRTLLETVRAKYQ